MSLDNIELPEGWTIDAIKRLFIQNEDGFALILELFKEWQREGYYSDGKPISKMQYVKVNRQECFNLKQKLFDIKEKYPREEHEELRDLHWKVDDLLENCIGLFDKLIKVWEVT
jgi:hypothetical protein